VSDVRDPEIIRHEIAETRTELGEAVEQLAAKTNVKARAREKTATLAQKAREHPRAVAAAGMTLLALLLLRRKALPRAHPAPPRPARPTTAAVWARSPRAPVMYVGGSRPTRTVDPGTKFSPAIVTSVPPATAPRFGVSDRIAGGGTAVVGVGGVCGGVGGRVGGARAVAKGIRVVGMPASASQRQSTAPGPSHASSSPPSRRQSCRSELLLGAGYRCMPGARSRALSTRWRPCPGWR